MPFQKNAKDDHAFAILRLDAGMAASLGMDPDSITVKTIVWTQDDAEREVTRLNRENAGSGSVYFWRIARLERIPQPEPNPTSAGPVSFESSIPTGPAR